MIAKLGRLVSVPVREVWLHEANDFTPWLAEPSNLTLLGETLQLGELNVQGTEVPVGNFYIDILARDLEDTLVVIENQFGPTDHTHLGQLMTYLAGQDGRVTVIWIAERFRDEHRAAIDWLNAGTIDGFNFFGVEVQAFRIGLSEPAPQFNVVAKPNDWSRNVTRATRGDISEQDFYAALAETDPTYPDALRSFLERCEGVGVQRELRRTYVLRVELPEDRPNLGTISKSGAVEIWSWPLDKLDKKLGEPIGRRYMERVVAFLVPDASIKPTKDNSYICYKNRAAIPLGVMLQHRDAWLAAIQEAVERLRALIPRQ